MKIAKPVLVGMLTATTVLGAGALSVSAEEGSSAVNNATSIVRSIFGLAEENEEDKGPVNPVDPEQPGEPGGPGGEDGPGPGEGGTGGPLRIDYASNFYFGEIEIDPVTGGSGYALPETWNTGTGSEEIPNFVQVTDNRGNNAGWTLTVAQTDQLRTEGGAELRAASITLGNIGAESMNASQNPHFSNSDITLVPGANEAVRIAWADEILNSSGIEDAMGVGTNIIRFGDSETADESVLLDVPGGVSIQEGVVYNTTFEWTLHNTPQ